MKQYSIFSAIWRAPLFLKSFYVDVATQWRGIGLRYLLLMELLTWALAFIPYSSNFSHFVDTDVAAAIKDFPPITLTAGAASSPVKQPYITYDHGRPLFVLDTTGTINSPADAKAEFLLTKTEFVQDDGRGMVRRTPLKGFHDGLYDQAWVMGWANSFRHAFVPLGLPLMILCGGVLRLLGALLFACIGLGLNAAFGGKLSFAALLRLTIVSMTTAMLINTLMILCHWDLGCFERFLFPGITLGYLTFGVKVAADATRPVSAFPVEMPGDTPLPPLTPDDGQSQFP